RTRSLKMRKIVLLSLVLLIPACKKKPRDSNDSPIVVSDTGPTGGRPGKYPGLVIEHKCDWKCDPMTGGGTATVAVVHEWIPIGFHWPHPFGDKYTVTALDNPVDNSSIPVTGAKSWTLILTRGYGYTVEVKSIGNESIAIECHGGYMTQQGDDLVFGGPVTHATLYVYGQRKFDTNTNGFESGGYYPTKKRENTTPPA